MDSPPHAAHTRSIRSFAQRDDADRAKAALDDAGIACTLREYRVPDPLTQKPVVRAITLFVASDDATESARLMLKLPPSDAPVATNSGPKAEAPSRLRRGVVRGGKQKSPLFMVGFAIACAAGMIIFATSELLGPKKKRQPPHSTDNILVEEDLNGDGNADVTRTFTWDFLPLSHAEDRNYDGEFDVRWLYQRGKPSSRDVDLNYDGDWDEHTAYNPEGDLFYTDSRPGGKGAVLARRIYRQGITWKILVDSDADNHFDHLTEYNDLGDIVHEEDLPKDHPANDPPVWPIPPWPPRAEDDEGVAVKP